MYNEAQSRVVMRTSGDKNDHDRPTEGEIKKSVAFRATWSNLPKEDVR